MILGTLSVSVIVVLWFILRYDMYRCEPLWAVALALVAGAATMFLAGAISSRVLWWSWPELDDPWWAFPLIASGIEEPFKLGAVVCVMFAVRRCFDEPDDGLLYGAMVGLGAAAYESRAFVDLAQIPEIELVAQNVARVLSHPVLTAIAAAPLGLRKVPRLRRWAWVLVVPTLGLSMSMHFAWNAMSVLAEAEGAARVSLNMAAIGIMIAGLGLLGLFLVLASRMAEQDLGLRPVRKLWGWPFGS
jgi:RsiW-degrading membrane proteinase PrsW (M82 family)